MSAFTNISYCLDTQTATLGKSTAWENKKYTPVEGRLYLRPTMLPGTTEQAGLGDAGLDKYSGTYQVDVFAPKNKGKGAALIQADLVADLFARGTILTHNGISVRIGNVSPGKGVEVDSWYIVPVFIHYQSFITPR